MHMLHALLHMRAAPVRGACLGQPAVVLLLVIALPPRICCHVMVQIQLAGNVPAGSADGLSQCEQDVLLSLFAVP